MVVAGNIYVGGDEELVCFLKGSPMNEKDGLCKEYSRVPRHLLVGFLPRVPHPKVIVGRPRAPLSLN